MNRWLLPACLAAALLTASCEAPPNKEMDQAQGALDAARAAGADRYATAEYTAATDSLTRSRQAVTERDYRLAMNHALESREHAQNAAREAADTRARLRGDAERRMAEIAGLLAQANARLQAAEARRVPRRTLRAPQAALSAVNADVQKAGEAMKADDYRAVGQLLEGLKARIEKVIADLDGGPPTQSARPRG
jgi:hypothetical protein